MRRKKEKTVSLLLTGAVILMSFICLLIGSSHMTVRECIDAMKGSGSVADIRIIRAIRLPRVLAALIAGAGLSLSGLMMQTALDNPMASPSTLGVSNAAVFGANLSIIAFSGGYLSTGHNVENYSVGASPYATSLLAFAFAALSILLILGLCKLKSFSPSVVVLSGVAMGSVWTAATTVLQFYATDVGLSAAVIWSFGDLGRATYKTDAIMLAVTLTGYLNFTLCRWQCNALLSGDATARSMGVSVDRLRFGCLLLSSLITAVIVSFLGIIGFVGVICPHLVKKLLGEDHRVTLPLSALSGSLLLLLSDTLSRSMGNGSALPVGAVTSLLGAPFFMGILLGRKKE